MQKEPIIDLSLNCRLALVCGASQGIGAATAQVLASMGAQVILMARNEESLAQVKGQLKDPDRHIICPQDLSCISELEKNIKYLLKDYGPVHILVNNSGGPKAGPIIDAKGEDFQAAFNQHVVANQKLAQLLVPGMTAQEYGRIINIISTSVKVPIPNLGISNTIRGAVANWAKSLANEIGPMGITVNNVLPGFTDTERLNTLREAVAQRLGKSQDEVHRMWINSVPLRRLARPEEVAQMVGFLASPAASFVSGINVPVDGGRTGCL